MTRRAGRSAANDPGLASILQTKARNVCMVGKTWDFHVDVALEVDRDEYLEMITDSLAYAKTRMDETMFDAEHFFDGYKANPDYAMACLLAAEKAGARWLVLCDTNGGTLPHEIERIVGEVVKKIPGDRSAFTRTTTPRMPSPTRSRPCARAYVRSRARSTGWASAAATPT